MEIWRSSGIQYRAGQEGSSFLDVCEVGGRVPERTG